MKKFIVSESPLTLNAGLIELTPEQARTRAHAIQNVKGDVYKITGPVQFKVGEKIGFDGDLPRVLAENLKTPAQIKEEERATAESRESSNKKLREEAARDAAAGLALALQERLQKRQAEFASAEQAFAAEQDEEKIDALADAVKVAEGRLAEVMEIVAEATK